MSKNIRPVKLDDIEMLFKGSDVLNQQREEISRFFEILNGIIKKTRMFDCKYEIGYGAIERKQIFSVRINGDYSISIIKHTGPQRSKCWPSMELFYVSDDGRPERKEIENAYCIPMKLIPDLRKKLLVILRAVQNEIPGTADKVRFIISQAR